MTKTGKTKASRPVKKSSIEHLFRPSHELINTMIAKWLMSEGLPFNITQAESFLEMMRVTAGDTRFGVASRDTYDAATNARFCLFTKAISALLLFNAGSMFGLKFVNAMHDGWRIKSKDSITGVSLAFIDHCWKFRHIAVLATVMPDGHEALLVANMMKKRLRDVYDMDIMSVVKWIMSDTASAARAVANYFPDMDQEDCAMHMMNLCITYGLGMRGNTSTKKSYDRKTESHQVVRKITTPGGAFEEGREVIRKLRSLSNYFSAGNRGPKLTRVQNALSFPELAPIISPDTRVAVCCKLIRRSILNYNAMASFFQSDKNPNPFSDITRDEWKLAIEMEAITNFISELALVEFQRESILPSYLLVFRHMAVADLKGADFRCLTLTKPEKHVMDETQVRKVVQSDKFSALGKVCIARCTEQVKSRFPAISKSMILALLLDPRTITIAAGIAANIGEASSHADTHIEDLDVVARSKLSKAHYDVFKIQQPHAISSSPEGQSPLIDAPAPRSNRPFLFGAPVPSPSKQRFRDGQILEKAEAVVHNWMELDVDWVQVSWFTIRQQ